MENRGLRGDRGRNRDMKKAASSSIASLSREKMCLDKSTTNEFRKNPRARSDYDEETAYESYMNPESGFQSGPGDSVDAD